MILMMEQRIINTGRAKNAIRQLSTEYFKDGFSLVGIKEGVSDSYFIFEKRHPVWDIVKTPEPHTPEYEEKIENVYNYLYAVVTHTCTGDIDRLLAYVKTYPTEMFAILQEFANIQFKK